MISAVILLIVLMLTPENILVSSVDTPCVDASLCIPPVSTYCDHCQNGGKCVGLSTGGYCCFCRKGFVGEHCSEMQSNITGCNVCSVDDARLPLYGTCGDPCEPDFIERVNIKCSPNPFLSICFPGAATVIVSHHDGDHQALGNRIRQVTMERLKIGDKVLSIDPLDGKVKYSEVFMFTHADKHVTLKSYVKLMSESGHYITASPGHYVWTSNGNVMHLIPIDKIKPKDVVFVSGADGMMKRERVNATSIVAQRGLYNPQTMNGNIFVNDILSSCYTDIVRDSAVSHGIMWFIRQIYSFIPIEISEYQQRYVINPIIDMIHTF